MKAIHLFVLLGAMLLTAGQMLAVDYSTTRLSTDQAAQTASATLIAQR